MLATVSAESLSSVTGGDFNPPPGFLNRQDFQNGGRQLTESAVLATGAAGGNLIGGPAGAFTGVMAGQLLNRTGVPGNAGDKLGGWAFDALSQPPTLDMSGGPQP